MQEIQIGGVFIAGILSFFSPCILPVIPVFISTLLGSVDKDSPSLKLGKLNIYAKPVLRVTLFVVGLSVSFMIMGLVFGALGRYINSLFGLAFGSSSKFLSSSGFMIVMGVIVILLGIYQTGLVKIPFLMREKKLESKRGGKGLLGAFLLGFTFSFGWTPCVGPVLAAVLALTVSWGGSLLSMFYMAVYSLGLLVPFLVFTLFSDLILGRIQGIYKHMNAIKIVGGIIIIIMGVFLLTDSLNLITQLAE